MVSSRPTINRGCDQFLNFLGGLMILYRKNCISLPVYACLGWHNNVSGVYQAFLAS
jgi:hypothetical protein